MTETQIQKKKSQILLGLLRSVPASSKNLKFCFKALEYDKKTSLKRTLLLKASFFFQKSFNAAVKIIFKFKIFHLDFFIFKNNIFLPKFFTNCQIAGEKSLF